MKEYNADYDEYRFNFDGLSHDPWKLAALLTVIYGEYSEETVKEALPRIFDMQYKLTKKGYKNRIARWAEATRTGTEHMFFVTCFDGEAIGFTSMNIREAGYLKD